MSVVYKILFEVQVLHEFYLTNQDGGSIFTGNAAARQAFLFDRFSLEDRNINSDLVAVLPDAALATFKNYKLRLLPSYSGFKVAVGVKPVALAGNKKGYLPVVPLPDDLDLSILLLKKGPSVDLITNDPFKKPVNVARFFSNSALTGPKTFPFLSAAISAFDAGATYEQGALARFGANDIRSFYLDGAGNPQWLNIPAGGYTSSNDSIVSGSVLNYSFDVAANITLAQFVLLDKNSNVVRTFNLGNGTRPLRQVTLDFTDPYDDVRMFPKYPVGEDTLYTLQVTGSGGYNASHRILFYNGHSNLRDVWGLVNLQPRVTNATFNLLHPSNRILTVRNADNSVSVPPPVFEIWAKSKLAFWRYTNDEGLPLDNSSHPDFLQFSNGSLVSKVPRNQSYRPTLYKKPDNSLHYLPNPAPFPELRWEDRKLFADILVPESSMFPLGP